MTSRTRQQWAERVRRWRASGLTARAYAAREELNPSTLRWWSSQLNRAMPTPGRFVEVPLPTTPAPAPAEPGLIELVLHDELRIRVSGNFDPSLLRRVLAALEGR